MKATNKADNEQKKLWNGLAGQAWVDSQVVLDQMFKPFEDLLVEAVRAKSATSVLDIGCGTGSTTLAVARLLGPKGYCSGVDISAPMIATATERAAREISTANFIVADAQTHHFEAARFDMLVSRFGVMFFNDPIAAFANLQRAARKNAELRFIAWRSPAQNPFMTTAERAVAPLLANMPVRKPGAAGQFAFADQDRIHQILLQSGWSAIDVQPIEAVCTFPENELIHYITRLGPLGLILQDVDAQTRDAVIETARNAFEIYVHGKEVRFNAACWMVVAQQG